MKPQKKIVILKEDIKVRNPYEESLRVSGHRVIPNKKKVQNRRECRGNVREY